MQSLRAWKPEGRLHTDIWILLLGIFSRVAPLWSTAGRGTGRAQGRREAGSGDVWACSQARELRASHTALQDPDQSRIQVPRLKSLQANTHSFQPKTGGELTYVCLGRERRERNLGGSAFLMRRVRSEPTAWMPSTRLRPFPAGQPGRAVGQMCVRVWRVQIS